MTMDKRMIDKWIQHISDLKGEILCADDDAEGAWNLACLMEALSHLELARIVLHKMSIAKSKDAP